MAKINLKDRESIMQGIEKLLESLGIGTDTDTDVLEAEFDDFDVEEDDGEIIINVNNLTINVISNDISKMNVNYIDEDEDGYEYEDDEDSEDFDGYTKEEWEEIKKRLPKSAKIVDQYTDDKYFTEYKKRMRNKDRENSDV